MSFANEFKRNQQGVTEEIAYYRSHADLEGIGEQIVVLEEMRDKWTELEVRYQGRGKMPSKPDDWDEDREIRSAAKESMNKIIKAAAALAEAESAEIQRENDPQ